MTPHRVVAPRKSLQNILWLVGERIARAGLMATVLGLVARHLEPAGFGQLNFAITATAIATALATLGLDGLVVNELIRRPGQEGAVLGTALRLRLAAGGATLAFLAGGTLLTPGLRENATLMVIVALGLVFQPAEVVDLWFQRHLDSRRTAIMRFGTALAGATLRLWLVARGAPVIAFAWALVAEGALFVIALGWAYRRGPQRTSPWSWDAQIAKTLWRRGLPLAVSGAVVVLSLRLDQLLVRTWLGETVSGIYFAAARLTEMTFFAGTAMTLSFFPALATSHAVSTETFHTRLQAMFDVLSAFGWAIALGFTLLGPWAISLLYGPAYAGAETVLALQGWACLFALSAGVRWQFILLAAPTGLNLAAALLNIGTQCALGWWWMPRFGAPGAAGAWFVGIVVSGFLSSFAFPALRPCARAQLRGLAIPFAPARWRAMLALFTT